MTTSRFLDRRSAGQALARRLLALGYGDQPYQVVLGLPRGGVPVAYEVATSLRTPLDVFLVRKLGAPGQEELAMGAIATGGVRVLNHDIIAALGISPGFIDRVAAAQQAELERRETEYRGSRPPSEVANRTVILIDDGLATGASMRAAVEALRLRAPRRIVVAVPVAAQEQCERLSSEVDEVVCLMTPMFFSAVGEWYEEFSQVSDEEVRGLLARATGPSAPVESTVYPSSQR